MKLYDLLKKQIAKLFDRNIKTIGKHINNALKEELDNSVVAKFATTANDGKTYQIDYYNLDIIININYRVKSKNGIIFRKWANKVLKDYSIERYTVDIINCSNLITNDEYNLLEKEVLIDLIINFLTN